MKIDQPRRDLEASTRIQFREYQLPVFLDDTTGLLVLHWSRQIGKSFTLAAWAVHRLMRRPGRLVTVLSNSRENGAEFLGKCAEICRLTGTEFDARDGSRGAFFEDMKMELRIRRRGQTGRIKVLAANPRTARGFSGDLILDEFAFHEDSRAIWDAAEPILSANPDYLCRIASTGNGRHNMFYELAAPALPSADAPELPRGGPCLVYSRSGHVLSRVSRTQAWWFGTKIYDPKTRREITPEEARAAALDVHSYDQNYECSFADECRALLSHENIAGAERPDIGVICDGRWSRAALDLLGAANGPLHAGFDVGRKVDCSVITVVEKLGEEILVRAILRLQNMRLPDQQACLGEICRLPRFRTAAIDMTGIGLGLFEYAQREFGAGRIRGINFAATVPATNLAGIEGRKRETVRVTEAMAMDLLRAYEERRLKHPADDRLRADLRKPERVTTPGGRVSIAATRDEAGHADHFWSLALAVEAAGRAGGAFAYEPVRRAQPLARSPGGLF